MVLIIIAERKLYSFAVPLDPHTSISFLNIKTSQWSRVDEHLLTCVYGYLPSDFGMCIYCSDYTTPAGVQTKRIHAVHPAPFGQRRSDLPTNCGCRCTVSRRIPLSHVSQMLKSLVHVCIFVSFRFRFRTKLVENLD